MNTTRVLLVGFGSMGRAHHRVITAHPLSSVVAIVEPQSIPPEFQVGIKETQVYKSVEEALDAETFDAAVIASSTPTHFKIARRLIEIRLPTLIEKPFSTSNKEVDYLVEIAIRDDVVIACGLLERFNPAFLTAQKLLKQPNFFMSVRHSPPAPRILSAVRSDLLIHDVDLALRVLGEEVKEKFFIDTFDPHPSRPQAFPETTSLVLKFGSHTQATLSASRLAQYKRRSLVIFDNEKTIDIDLLRRTISTSRNIYEDSTSMGKGYVAGVVQEFPEIVEATEPLYAQWEWFIGQLDSANVTNWKEELGHARLVHRVVLADM
jgi:predicted dehydrogenase